MIWNACSHTFLRLHICEPHFFACHHIRQMCRLSQTPKMAPQTLLFWWNFDITSFATRRIRRRSDLPWLAFMHHQSQLFPVSLSKNSRQKLPDFAQTQRRSIRVCVLESFSSIAQWLHHTLTLTEESKKEWKSYFGWFRLNAIRACETISISNKLIYTMNCAKSFWGHRFKLRVKHCNVGWVITKKSNKSLNL